MNPTDKKDIHKFLDTVTAELAFSEARAAVRMEMQAHLEDSIDTAKSYGLSEAEAIQESIKRIGDPQSIGKSLNLIHQPKFDFLLPILSFGLCLIGLWNLSSGKWIGLQSAWIAIGFLLVACLYCLSAKKFKNVLSSLYILAILGLGASYFSGI